MITKDLIDSDIIFYKSFRKRLAENLRNLPTGRLYFKMCNGHKRPFVMEDGKERYLGQKYIRRIAGLQKRRMLEECISGIDHNIALLEKLSPEIADFESLIPPFVEVPDSPSGRGRKSQSQISAAIDRWAETSAGKPVYKGNHTASDGTNLKSRAELALYEFFLSQDLKPIYEKPLLIDGDTWYPDFSFLRCSDGEHIIWEHFGMMNDPQYQDQALHKLSKYASYGFLPFINLIATYDYGNDRIDLPYARKLLRVMDLI